MTETELRDRLEPLLNRHPFVPIRVDGDAGPITIISNPYRVDLFEGTLTIHHKDEGRRPVAVVKAEQVKELVPFDELPGEPGCLSYREFHELYRSLSRATPFRSFEVELIDGRRLAVEKQGAIRVNGRFAVADRDTDGKSVLFPVAGVVSVSVLQPAEVA